MQKTDQPERKMSTANEKPKVSTNWVMEHYDDDVHAPWKPLPVPLTSNVTAKAPLEFDLFWSMRSPYSYLVLDRILALNATYNVKTNFRPTLPIAIKVGGFPGAPWYRWNYDMMDQHRVAKFLGVPFRRPNPEPVVQNTYPPDSADLKMPPEQEQPYIHHLTRLAAAAQDQDKGLAFLDKVMRMMWDGSTDNWPDFLIEYMDRAGMDGKATDADVKSNPDKYDAILEENAVAQHATGHGGVPNMAFNGEPFFGEDRFDLFFYRLKQNGLTRRSEAQAQLPLESWTGA